jgi:hypothetical protein
MPYVVLFEAAEPLVEVLGFAIVVAVIAYNQVNWPYLLAFFLIAILTGQVLNAAALLIVVPSLSGLVAPQGDGARAPGPPARLGHDPTWRGDPRAPGRGPGTPHEIGGIPMSEKRRTTVEEAKRVGDEIGVDWSRFDLEQFRHGMDVEFEHGSHDPQTDVTHDDPIVTGKIALAHMKEFPDYYERLERMEAEAERAWAAKRA